MTTKMIGPDCREWDWRKGQPGHYYYLVNGDKIATDEMSDEHNALARAYLNLRAKVEALTKERDRAVEQWLGWQKRSGDDARAEAAEARCAELVKYTRHDDLCGKRMRINMLGMVLSESQKPCTCGLDQALAGAGEKA